MSLLEPDCGVVWLKYEEPGSETMLMCSSVRVFMWYLLSTPRTCAKFDPFDHQIIFPLCHSYQTGHHSALVPYDFSCVLGGLASINYFRPVDWRHETKIVQN